MNVAPDSPHDVPPVTAIILHWASAADTLRCLSALDGDAYPSLSVLVVDNGSPDSAQEVLRARPDTVVLRLSANRGYAGGNNAGIARAIGDGAAYVFLLNDDTVVESSTVSRLVAEAQVTDRPGLLGPKVLVLPPERGADRSDTILSAGGIVHQDLESHLVGLGEADAGQYDKSEDVAFLSGCALMAGRDLIESVGTLDEAFFAYREEVDWALRARAAGFSVRYVADARVWHPDTRSRDSRSKMVTYLMARNHLRLARKHGRPSLVWQVRGSYLRTVMSWTVKSKWAARRPLRRALADALIDDVLGRTRVPQTT